MTSSLPQMEFFAKFYHHCVLIATHRGFTTASILAVKNILEWSMLGRYLCPVCRRTITEDSGFGDNLTDQFFGMLAEICQLLRIHHVLYEGIESVLSFLIPRNKETVRNILKHYIWHQGRQVKASNAL